MVYLNPQQSEPSVRNQTPARPNHLPFLPNPRRGRVPLPSNQSPLRANNASRAATPSSVSSSRDSASNHSSSSSQQNPGPTESFVVLSESTLGAARAHQDLKADSSTPPQPQDQSRSTSSTPPSPNTNDRVFKLAELLSNNPSRFDHPLCTECTDKLLEWMHNQLQSAKSNRDRYAIFERELNREKTAATDGSYETCKKIKQDIEEVSLFSSSPL